MDAASDGRQAERSRCKEGESEAEEKGLVPARDALKRRRGVPESVDPAKRRAISEEIGGVDGTRTRGLCRDRAAF
jgi:hypothetical protein